MHDSPTPVAGDAVTMTFERGPSACSAARIWAHAQLAPLGLGADLAENIVLCIDELVANVVEHTLSDPVLTITTGNGVLVEVADTSSVGAAIREQGSRLGGWGLRIVDRIADTWGCAQTDTGGKIVWFAVSA